VLAPLLLLTLSADVWLQPGTARPGDLVLVTVSGLSAAPSGKLGTDELTFLAAPGKPAGRYEALAGLKVDQKSGVLTLELTGRDEQGPVHLTGTLDVLAPAFRHRELTVGTKFTSPSKKDQQRSAKDQVAFTEAFDRDFEPFTFSGDFAWPRPPDLTAPFGDIRLLNGKKQSQHFGIDLDSDIGDPIWAANDGTVVMARDCFASGNTVLIHHGARLFTAYFHLSKFEVKQGQVVTRGQRIGLVGKTGRVTGPHLHWGVKIDGRWANPVSLLALRFDPTTPLVVAPTPEVPDAGPTDQSTSPDASRGMP
jgi:murein DD-endopeptidase MepM/ murein hydrolase activator NlpD